MKKVISFFRSMKFGMILLVLVIVCSFAGSLIVQQREPMEYVNRYGAGAAEVILALGLFYVSCAESYVPQTILYMRAISPLHISKNRAGGGMPRLPALPLMRFCIPSATNYPTSDLCSASPQFIRAYFCVQASPRIAFRSSSGVVVGCSSYILTSVPSTFGERKAGSVGPR